MENISSKNNSKKFITNTVFKKEHKYKTNSKINYLKKTKERKIDSLLYILDKNHTDTNA